MEPIHFKGPTGEPLVAVFKENFPVPGRVLMTIKGEELFLSGDWDAGCMQYAPLRSIVHELTPGILSFLVSAISPERKIGFNDALKKVSNVISALSHPDGIAMMIEALEDAE